MKTLSSVNGGKVKDQVGAFAKNLMCMAEMLHWGFDVLFTAVTSNAVHSESGLEKHLIRTGKVFDIEIEILLGPLQGRGNKSQ